MDMKTTRMVLLTKISLLILLTVFSFCVASTKAAKLPVFENSATTLEESKNLVMKVTGVTIGLSFVITLLPDDWGTPLADSLADLNKYLVLMLGMIFFENLLLSQGVPIIFRFLIPAALVLFIVYLVSKKELIKTIATKLLALSLVVILVVPCGTSVSNWLCSSSMTYVNETITMAEDGTNQVEEITESGSTDKSFYEKVSRVFNTAIGGVKDLFNYYKDMVGKFINAIAIMLVAYCVIPVVTFILLFWILNQLFQFDSFRDGSAGLRREVNKLLTQMKNNNEKAE
ncbi:hypothetical protein [Pseudobutyrivibrio xylanivorans]|uniref:Beta-carotene 15,15'-monooxygenase n=1 Tax=Pseudobutyrivibrio xylanivorans TaxID=185007 RepID=A0A5P6VUT8_PSEXY|nr:hypothetical protein [Pseudobutyrivibrio xylanivorans]QFJ55998.1 hypothetical protein FXF36_14405 [Pseudobutyrivibrio xylanivorans]